MRWNPTTRQRVLRVLAQVILAAVMLLLSLVLLSLSFSCGPSTRQIRTQYTTEVARCQAAEHEIEIRAGTTADQDAADLTTERARCDNALALIRAGCGRRCR